MTILSPFYHPFINHLLIITTKPIKTKTMRNTAQFFRIKWKGHNLTVEAYVSGGDVDIENIEGISAMDMYFECIGGNVGEIETLVAEANNEPR